MAQQLIALGPIALRACHCELRDKLDIDEIYPHLNAHQLLTSKDSFKLCDRGRCMSDKVDDLVEILSRKPSSWWDKFIVSLKKTASCTAHAELAQQLESELERQRVLPEPVGDETVVRRVSTGCNVATHPTGISQSWHDFVQESDIGDIVQPELWNKMQVSANNWQIVSNLIHLMKCCDELLGVTKKFSVALADLLRLYVRMFRGKLKQCNSLLSQTELEVVKIIEEISECTQAIDMDKETKEWNGCVDMMEKYSAMLKDALYSRDPNEMARVQDAWKLSEDEARHAHDWIKTREAVVLLGKKYVIELDEMKNKENVHNLVEAVYNTVCTRVAVGDRCLKAWTNWINCRANLNCPQPTTDT